MKKWRYRSGHAKAKAATDFGLQVNFSSIDDEDPEEPAAAFARLDKEISDKTAEIERVASDVEAMERYDALFITRTNTYRLLLSPDGEAEQTRRESKRAKDHFNDVKMRR